MPDSAQDGKLGRAQDGIMSAVIDSTRRGLDGDGGLTPSGEIHADELVHAPRPGK